MSEEVHTATHDVAYWQRRALQAEQREAITADAYNQQQSSYRELETLYQASQERTLRAGAVSVQLVIARHWACLWKYKAKARRTSFYLVTRMWTGSMLAKIKVEEENAALRAELNALRSTLQVFFKASTYDERGAIRVQLRQMVRAK